jgi:hypothetical protein
VALSGLTTGAMLAWWPHNKLMSKPSSCYAQKTEQPQASGRSSASPTLNIVI